MQLQTSTSTNASPIKSQFNHIIQRGYLSYLHYIEKVKHAITMKIVQLFLLNVLFAAKTLSFISIEINPIAPLSRRVILKESEQSDKETKIIRPKKDDVSNRFKYKVNALMGVFDPPIEKDHEREEGQILNAMLNFPTTYTFTVIGKTGGDPSLKDAFVEQVKEIVLDGSADTDEDAMPCEITCRSNKFTKVTVKAQVESVEMISAIYRDLQKMELSVMQF